MTIRTIKRFWGFFTFKFFFKSRRGTFPFTKAKFIFPFRLTLMENQESQQTYTTSGMGSLIVEGGFEDQVCVTNNNFN